MGFVRLEVEGGVAHLILDSPDTRNALDVPAADELIAACDEVAARQDIGAAIISGVGEAFCAGAHRGLLAQVGRDPAATDAYDGLGKVYESFVRFGELPVPTIAAVHGAAVGAGLNLALAATLRIVAEDARLISGFFRIGVHPGGGHFRLLERLGGREASAGMGLFGSEIDGMRAVALGLAWDAVAPADVVSRAHSIAAPLGEDPALARATLATYQHQTDGGRGNWRSSVAAERAAQMWSLRRRDAAPSGSEETPLASARTGNPR